MIYDKVNSQKAVDSRITLTVRRKLEVSPLAARPGKKILQKPKNNKSIHRML